MHIFIKFWICWAGKYSEGPNPSDEWFKKGKIVSWYFILHIFSCNLDKSISVWSFGIISVEHTLFCSRPRPLRPVLAPQEWLSGSRRQSCVFPCPTTDYINIWLNDYIYEVIVVLLREKSAKRDCEAGNGYDPVLHSQSSNSFVIF